ncbi:hypothetical protein NA57DRAFT_78606 [Rhizodiscina lignyota]|uniref:Major royal jelly protein n=1 Tax=Rhizodiscina lignyota TaxID=1504668 RepID=A0A9P4IAG1_9PEZI|nr:hypothetical protein NA57DRAFT_78606 [Rhizodiscina lignyota]
MASRWTFLLLFTLVAASNNVTTAPGSSESLVHKYPRTWIENLAVRPNGRILPATATSAVLMELNPANGEQRVVHNFTGAGGNANAIMTIADVQGQDLFLINTMECDIFKLACINGTGITWLVDLRGRGPAKIKKLVTGPNAQSILNGAAALNHQTVLMVDQNLGGIWSVDITRPDTANLFTNPAMLDPTNSGNGVNGIRVRGNTLYFNNPSAGTFARIRIDPRNGCLIGNATIITSGLTVPDDFEIDRHERFAYFSNDNELLKIDLSDGNYDAIVKGLPGPTTARWTRSWHGFEYGYSRDEVADESLYVATAGGTDQWLSGNPTILAAIYRVTV